MSARSVKISKAGSQYINKYLKTQIANGNLQVVNSTSDALYFFKGSEILDNVNVILPVLQGDDTVAFQNNNNNFSGVQTFTKGVVSQGGLLLLPDPLGQLEDDLQITDGLNLVLGINQGTEIGTAPSQLLGFFGNDPISQPGVTNPSTSTSMVQDMWNALVNLGLISSQAASSSFSFPVTGGALPSQMGGRYGIIIGSTSTYPPTGVGLLTTTNSVSGAGTTTATFINNRPATAMPTGTSSGNFGGWRTNTAIFTPSNNPTMRFKVAMSTNTSSRLILGCCSSSSLSTGFNSVLGSNSGFMIGFDSGSTAYTVCTNNGGTQTNNTAGMPSLQTAGNAAIFTLSWNNTTPSLTWSVQTATSTTTSGTITTGNLPASSTQMFMFCCCQTATTSAVTLTAEDSEIVLGNDYSVLP